MKKIGMSKITTYETTIQEIAQVLGLKGTVDDIDLHDNIVVITM